MQAVAEKLHLEPGVGVYLPSFVPHWVETEAGISISFSIPFDTTYVERAESRHTDQQANATAASLPAADWLSERVDKTKAAVARSLMRLGGNHGSD